jgi:activator of HSP90 ATPase
LQNQLSTAITSAIQTAEQSGNTANLNSAIQGAVDQVLQNNGINPDALQQQASGQIHGSHHHHHHGESSSTNQASNTSSQTSDATTSNGSTTQTGASTSTAATQQTANQQIAELLSRISGASSGNQSISGFLFNVQT